MRQNGYIPDTANAITRYFNKAALPTQQEILGNIVMEILREGRNVSRKAICTKLLHRVEAASDRDEVAHYHTMIGLLFER
ncbi:MAG TPA: regulatory protein YcgZ [Enterobacteriaceae bacterium]|nr:regulatory protein YcgZ [Enterobacteriaceae bacterium]